MPPVWRGPTGVPPRQYEAVARRANHQCEYCLAPEEFFNNPFEVEHLMPRARGGGHDIDNLALACRNCNGSKLARIVLRDPESGAQVRIFHPRLDRWSDHFVFQLTDDGVEIAGKTAVGRATAAHLLMNTVKAVEARTLWFDFYSK
jgi:HNH endonuclease